MSDLHAPTLRRVIEMLDGEIALNKKLYDEVSARDLPKRNATLRAFRERLEREAEKAGG